MTHTGRRRRRGAPAPGLPDTRKVVSLHTAKAARAAREQFRAWLDAGGLSALLVMMERMFPTPDLSTNVARLTCTPCMTRLEPMEGFEALTLRDCVAFLEKHRHPDALEDGPLELLVRQGGELLPLVPTAAELRTMGHAARVAAFSIGMAAVPSFLRAMGAASVHVHPEPTVHEARDVVDATPATELERGPSLLELVDANERALRRPKE